MLLSTASRRDRAAADADAAERLRSVRERLEAAVSGLGELDYLRQRQEVLVRSALELGEEQQEQEVEEERRREARVRSEEKVLEENILLLRKQLVGSHLSLTRSGVLRDVRGRAGSVRRGSPDSHY